MRLKEQVILQMTMRRTRARPHGKPIPIRSAIGRETSLVKQQSKFEGPEDLQRHHPRRAIMVRNHLAEGAPKTRVKSRLHSLPEFLWWIFAHPMSVFVLDVESDTITSHALGNSHGLSSWGAMMGSAGFYGGEAMNYKPIDIYGTRTYPGCRY